VDLEVINSEESQVVALMAKIAWRCRTPTALSISWWVCRWL